MGRAEDRTSAKLDKRERKRTPLRVEPEGELAGHLFLMNRLSATAWVRQRRGEWTNEEMVDECLNAIVDTTLPEGTRLDLKETGDLIKAWLKAMQEEAVPPLSGERSQEP